MFRRFMIVCWVLFALVCLIGLAAEVRYWHLQGEIDKLSAMPLTEFSSSENPFAALKRESPDDDNADDNALVDIVNEVMQGDSVRENAKQAAISAVNQRRGNARVTSHLSAVTAGLILLWNLICHTGHWIWMGRKKDD